MTVLTIFKKIKDFWVPSHTLFQSETPPTCWAMVRLTEQGWCPVPTPSPASSGCKPGPRDRELETFMLGARAHQGPLNFSKERITLPRPRQVLSAVPTDQGSDERADTLTDSHHTRPVRAPLQPHLLHLVFTLHTPAALIASCLPRAWARAVPSAHTPPPTLCLADSTGPAGLP